MTAPASGDPDCPECGADVERVLPGERRRRLSKFVSGALRHFPDEAGLELDDSGWADYAALEDAVVSKYEWADPQLLAAVVATDPKGRFEREGGRIRAAYGHSVDVTLGASENDAENEIPDRLYHGTDPDNLDSIHAEGLHSMNRQEVHLSGTPAEAREVGRRHTSSPVVLEIDASEMVADGHRISKRGAETYTADEVPPEYLDVREQEERD
nr:RNA 2'-phosphotransferase [Halorussus sp. MSC15.2]